MNRTGSQHRAQARRDVAGTRAALYNLVSDQFTGLNDIAVPGTLRDSLVLLSVVLARIMHEGSVFALGAVVGSTVGCFDVAVQRACCRSGGQACGG